MSRVKVTHPTAKIDVTIPLTSSKSESNRALIIQALAEGGIELKNLAEARDTQTMIRLLASEEQTLDVLDAGTTMRFLTAWSVATGRDTIMTGTERMQERPIAILAEALKELGGDVEYLGKEGYPPLRIKGFKQKTNQISVKGDVSSQYISALLMIAPVLPEGLELKLLGEVASRPYIEMTLQLMTSFGVDWKWDGDTITVAHQAYQAGTFTVESDWSGASYWYSIAALAKDAKIKLLNLREESLQGDSAIVEIMEKLGVNSTFDAEGVLLTKGTISEDFDYDFTHCPDLAQTIVALCAALGVKARLTGLKSLRIKETDRIQALYNEVKKLGTTIEVIGDDEIIVPVGQLKFPEGVTVDTYEDHRMAMAFAPLALVHPVVIEEPDVVKKSYPRYWEHLELAGFEVE
ncbi:3-phosphoshikimate 1-carboxyvinyltransferase [Limibacter armeniacum]|uniref:3-phosphoshikimate 1-carboxyvinyltransferase n=1 Tax=Limibacter armeniacum TaxID=466084 RepID=UPI002FE51522